MIGTNKHWKPIRKEVKPMTLGATMGNKIVIMPVSPKHAIKKGLLPIMSNKNPLPKRAASETNVA